ncbi:hypothetical protein [Nocardiopsis aegyptia]|uniref:Uncharacterized protein n=1 Tax=Nocardiopsis aegyptia TaxID=220378 RepID=A0A7Z0EUR0_9ACTN|nr:hypothetical protein [Nocardiopsis aegyptia]NYJ37663.1 hypothetical protein [Nocardiopsis aegyptia]
MSTESNDPHDSHEVPASGEQPGSTEWESKSMVPPTRSPRPLLLVSVGATLGLLVGVGSTLLVTSLDFSGNHFEAAVDDCGITAGAWARIGDDGESLSLDNRGADESSGISVDSLFCILVELEAPDSVVEEMSQTRALDGRQSADWDGIHASWAYHPDTGLDVVLSRS